MGLTDGLGRDIGIVVVVEVIVVVAVVGLM